MSLPFSLPPFDSLNIKEWSTPHFEKEEVTTNFKINIETAVSSSITTHEERNDAAKKAKISSAASASFSSSSSSAFSSTSKTIERKFRTSARKNLFHAPVKEVDEKVQKEKETFNHVALFDSMLNIDCLVNLNTAKGFMTDIKLSNGTTIHVLDYISPSQAQNLDICYEEDIANKTFKMKIGDYYISPEWSAADFADYNIIFYRNVGGKVCVYTVPANGYHTLVEVVTEKNTTMTYDMKIGPHYVAAQHHLLYKPPTNKVSAAATLSHLDLTAAIPRPF